MSSAASDPEKGRVENITSNGGTGGLTQFIAGMWEFPRGNVFGATAFASYGSFWISYATIFIPGSGIMAAFSDPQELNNAIGIYLIAWFMITVFFLYLCFSFHCPPLNAFVHRLAVLRRNVAFTVLLSCLSVALLLLAIAEWNGMEQCVLNCAPLYRYLHFFKICRVQKAGGVFGIVTGLVAFYIGVSELLVAEPRAVARLPQGLLHT
ncbi:hypothetical protein HHX47_DHR7000359 [Lentinula edodes]|nr:hypothetical protein HHX47_DHR7000359 [Lentinula edodes]